ncbi:unnamed protein product [Malus baccata var. baccata]
MVTVNLGMLHYVLDHVYSAFMHRTKISPQFFSRGWGGTKLELLERMINQLFPEAAGQNWPPAESKTASLREGVFRTPCDEQLLSALPPESHSARVAFLVPKLVPPQRMACVVHLAGIITVHNYSPRFYGQRRPVMQRGAKFLCVSDLLLLGRATIQEARSLLHWLDCEAGFGKMGVCGLAWWNTGTLHLITFLLAENIMLLWNLGGVHAAMVGSLHPTPIATLPFLPPHSAVVAFCEGILKHATAWEALREDLAERMRNVLSLTDVTRFPIPKNPNAVIFVSATDDGYIPKHSLLELQKAWPGSEVRWVTGGHVSSFLLHDSEFRRAIVDGLDRLPWKESPL